MTGEEEEPQMKLQHTVALITGTSPNIGGGIAMGMADAGAQVVCVEVQPDNAHRCADAIKQRGGEALGVVCDVPNEAHVQATVARARGREKLMKNFRAEDVTGKGHITRWAGGAPRVTLSIPLQGA
jgi:NAD(P)-dependent dehydrogenase (short-subunit alcohol dehydrogenase family)